MSAQIEFRPNRPILLANDNCPYCGKTLDDSVPSNKEHVVGRNFVPRGTLENQLNLILRACAKCNTEKSQLEDDISVISMISSHVSRGDAVEAVLAAEVARKAHRAGSRRTGMPVAASQEKTSVQGDLGGGGTFSVGFIAPPQIDHERVYRLAQLHIDAFFYEATFNEESKRGGFFPGKAHSNIGYFPRTNWGGVKAKWFMETTAEWPVVVCAVAAQGYFRVIIREAPSKRMFSCAVEWNHTIRVLRLVGYPDEIQTLVNTMPETEGTWFNEPSGHRAKLVEEKTLDPAEDSLFVVTAPEGGSPPLTPAAL